MDLRNLDTVAACERGMEVIIRDLQNQDSNMLISVVGVDSATYRKEHQRLQAKTAIAEKRGKPIVGEELEALYIELSAKCTTGWKNMELNGVDVAFNFEKALEVYNAYPTIKTQVFVALYDRDAFLGNVTKNLSTS